MGYSDSMIEIRKTEIFAAWLDGLEDIRGRARNRTSLGKKFVGVNYGKNSYDKI